MISADRESVANWFGYIARDIDRMALNLSHDERDLMFLENLSEEIVMSSLYNLRKVLYGDDHLMATAQYHVAMGFIHAAAATLAAVDPAHLPPKDERQN